MKIKVIGDELTCLGFNLGGVSTFLPENRESLAEEFEKSLEDNELGLLLITEEKANLIREKVERQKTEGEKPLVVEIPSRAGWKERGKALKLISSVLSIKL